MRRALPGMLFALLLVAVYADPLFFRRNFAGRDLLAYHLPMESAIHDAYARGRLPVWISEVSGGRPLAANANAGALYPVRALLSPLPFPAAMRIYPVLHCWLAGLGVLLLLRSFDVSPAAAWVGAATYTFSGVGVSEVFYPNIHPGMVLLPWVVWAVRREDARPARKLLVLSLLLGLDLLAGDVFTVGLALLAAFAWVLVAERGEGRRRGIGLLVGAFALAFLIAAPQIVSTALWVPLTRRAISGLTLGEVLRFSIHPLRLIELVVPFPFGGTWEIDRGAVWGFHVFGGAPCGFFSSLYAGSLAVIAAAALWRSGAASARFARVLLVGGLALSVPGSLLPAGLAERMSPVALRFPEKFAVAIALALAIFAGLGVDQARRWSRAPRWTVVAGVVLAALAIWAALFPAAAGRRAVGLAGEDPSLARVAAEQLPGALAEGGLLWVVTLVALDVLRGAGRRREVVALVLLSLVPIVADRRIARAFSEEAVFAPTPFARMVARKDPEGAFRVLPASLFREASRLGIADLGSDVAHLEFPRRTWFEYTQALWGRGTVFNSDFDRGDLSRLESLRRLVATQKLPEPALLFATLSLRWSIRYRDEPAVPGYVRVGGDRVQEWDENAAALPDIRLARRFEETGSASEALGVLAADRFAADVVLETGERRSGRSSGGVVRVLERSPERLRLETESSEAGFLFVLRGCWPYRDVRVDGQEVEVIPAQLAFSAAPVPAGRHRVDWKERLPGFEASRWGPVLFVLVAALLLVRGNR